MLLGEIRAYLQKYGVASLQDVATHFDITPEAAQFALDYWRRKGKVREQTAVCSTGGCGGKNCGDPKAATTYEWTKRDIPLRWFPSKP
ncbi:FeoC-like transcriptional regulator [Candidatus Thiothrix sp. Deng01]|uniref:FeoC-like transcriptional regulator n=1 Tax=Candidatus Thiothrix phosphatis TaxID=3112415 RepID=A0ABU6D0A0_9GAMM|nr:FeoC-like transcriptional regulator [Candidatus Thiothrix sp. Deng01]MEB4592232.1 FeoC-like transcriptional regulator [Candidatus Thiothrix sp. Deng01]